MKLLLDQGLPRSTVSLLSKAGLVAEHVGGLGMASATDAAILQEAVRRDAVLVSLDSDFHSLLAASGDTQPSVIRVRIEGLSGASLAMLLAKVVAAIESELTAGAVASVTKDRIRVRALPIGKQVP